MHDFRTSRSLSMCDKVNVFHKTEFGDLVSALKLIHFPKSTFHTIKIVLG